MHIKNFFLFQIGQIFNILQKVVSWSEMMIILFPWRILLLYIHFSYNLRALYFVLEGHFYRPLQRCLDGRERQRSAYLRLTHCCISINYQKCDILDVFLKDKYWCLWFSVNVNGCLDRDESLVQTHHLNTDLTPSDNLLLQLLAAESKGVWFYFNCVNYFSFFPLKNNTLFCSAVKPTGDHKLMTLQLK